MEKTDDAYGEGFYDYPDGDDFYDHIISMDTYSGFSNCAGGWSEDDVVVTLMTLQNRNAGRDDCTGCG